MAVAGKTTVLPVQTGVSWDHDALPREGVYCSAEPGSLIHELVAECPSLSEAANWYRAPWFMANGHILTVWSALRRDAPEVIYSRRCLVTPDGGTLGLDFVQGVMSDRHTGAPAPAPSSGPLVLLCPGLGGDSEDAYVRSMAAAVTEHGFQCAVLNLRGCGHLDVTSPQLFSARRGSTADLQYALSMLKEELPAGNLIFAAGWSNGGSILLNGIREYEEEGSATGEHAPHGACPLAGAVALAVPFDMHLPSQAMETRLGKFVYDRNFLRSLLPKVESFLNRWSADLSHIDAAAVRDSQSLKDMEIHLISPMFGYKSVEEYYRDASTNDAIARITLPTLCISAMDDPIALSAGLPLQAFSQSAAAALACTRSGGHIGWPDLNRGSRASRTEAVLLQFFDAIVRRKEK
eukprot:jgi/Tetstr1/465937/TSEL_010551.t1